MSRVVSSFDYSSLRPQSQGIVFNSRPPATADKSSRGSRQSSVKSTSTASVSSVPNPKLSTKDIEEILLQKTAAKEDELKKAFQTVDIDQTLKVTKGEFRRVIETFIFPLTEEQFDAVLAKIPGTSNVTVPYFEFLSRFAKPIRSLCTKSIPNSPGASQPGAGNPTPAPGRGDLATLNAHPLPPSHCSKSDLCYGSSCEKTRGFSYPPYLFLCLGLWNKSLSDSLTETTFGLLHTQ